AIEEALSLQPGYPIMVHSLVLSILVSMGRSMGYTSSTLQSKSVSRMDLIAGYVEDNLYQQITPADIAAYLNLSEKQVSRIVLSSEGISTKRFITLAKIGEAKTLLAESDMSLGEIARSLGFATASYFNTVFRNVEGTTPGAFRAQR
ncbi:MAG: helix-turn-helix transcriptional regulator, partial [Spirochaetales bacterium]|nr:helix-turn-helix transcriptional regulator [Spirochaetales bacterium]